MPESVKNIGHSSETVLHQPENSTNLREWVEPTWVEHDIGIVENGAFTPSNHPDTNFSYS